MTTTLQSFPCSLAAHHARGHNVFSAQTTDLALPADGWPIVLLATLPDGTHVRFWQAFRNTDETVAVYASVEPVCGLTLILHAPLAGIALGA